QLAARAIRREIRARNQLRRLYEEHCIQSPRCSLDARKALPGLQIASLSLPSGSGREGAAEPGESGFARYLRKRVMNARPQVDHGVCEDDAPRIHTMPDPADIVFLGRRQVATALRFLLRNELESLEHDAADALDRT